MQAQTTEHSVRNTLNDQTLENVPVTAIAPSQLNPRKRFDPDSLQELADSIRTIGLLEPIVVRHAPDTRTGDGPRYIIIAGERRWRAAQLAGVERVPCRLLTGITDEDHLRIALVENLQRRDLDPLEEAEGYRQLNKVIGLRQTAIAEAVNRSQPHIANRMRLLELPPDVQELISRGDLSPSHGVSLLRYHASTEVMSKLAEIAAASGWTQKDLDRAHTIGWGVTDQLEKAGVIRTRSYATEFDRSACDACPFGAYIGSWCLRPDHFDELQAAAVQAKQEQTRQLIEQAKASGTELRRLADLPYGSYESLEYRKAPSGCSTSCPCRASVLGGDGEATTICTDPKRFRGLIAAGTRDKKKSDKVRHQNLLGTLLDEIDQIEEPDSMALAVIVDHALSQLGRNHGRKQAIDRQALGVVEVKAWEGYDETKGRRQRLEALASLAPAQLVKLAIEAILRHELHEHFENGMTYYFRAPWFLGLEEHTKRDVEASTEPVAGGVS